MSQISIQVIPQKGAATAARVSTERLVGEARHAVQVATKEAAAADVGAQQVIQPVHSGTYVHDQMQAIPVADGSTEYVKFDGYQW